MACTLSASGLLPLKQQVVSRSSRRNSVCVKASSQTKQFIAQKSEQLSKSVAAATTSALSFAAAPQEAFASANESISDVALANVNILGVIAVALFIIIPVSFLVILYVKSTAEGNVSGGFSQSYYDESKKMGKKLTNEAALLKGKGTGMRPEK
jgi:photosystem II PsbM protein